MNTYNAVYILNGEEVHKSVKAANIYKAKAAFSAPDMLPNEFIGDYENMRVSIMGDHIPGIELAVMTYNDIKYFQ